MAGAGAAMSVQVPTLPARLQIWSGLLHSVSQHTSSTQLPDTQSAESVHGAPSGAGVLVAVAVGVTVGVAVAVSVGVCVAVSVGVAVGVLVGVAVAVAVGVSVGV